MITIMIEKVDKVETCKFDRLKTRIPLPHLFLVLSLSLSLFLFISLFLSLSPCSRTLAPSKKLAIAKKKIDTYSNDEY